MLMPDNIRIKDEFLNEPSHKNFAVESHRQHISSDISDSEILSV